MRVVGVSFPLPRGGCEPAGAVLSILVCGMGPPGPSDIPSAAPLSRAGAPRLGVTLPAAPSGGRGSAPIRVLKSPASPLFRGRGPPRWPPWSRPASPLLRGSDALLRLRRFIPGRTGRLWRPAPAAPHTVKSMLPAHRGPRSVGRAPGYTLRGSGSLPPFRVFCRKDPITHSCLGAGIAPRVPRALTLTAPRHPQIAALGPRPLGVAAPRRFAYSITVPDLSITAPRFDLRHRGGRCAGRPVPRHQHGNITRSPAFGSAPTSAASGSRACRGASPHHVALRQRGLQLFINRGSLRASRVLWPCPRRVAA